MYELLQAAMRHFSPSEAKVARVCVKHFDELADLTGAGLARLACVSSPTVLRFCRSLGFSGIEDFRGYVTSRRSTLIKDIRELGAHGDTDGEILKNITCSAISSLTKLSQQMNVCSLEKAVNALENAYEKRGRVHFYGLGNSGIVCKDAEFKLGRLGIQSNAYCDEHLQVIAACHLIIGDCAVFVSRSGHTKTLVDLCKVLNNKGITTIAIAPKNSSLADAGQIQLETSTGAENYENIPMATRLVQLLVIDMLATSIGKNICSHEFRLIQKEVAESLTLKRKL